MSYRKTGKTFESILKSWYGNQEFNPALMNWHPEPEPVSNAVFNVLKKSLPKSMAAVAKIKAEWSNIVGEMNAAASEPVALENSVLTVEVSHPAYRMALDTPALKKIIIQRIKEDCGAPNCESIRFMPPGRRKKNKTEDTHS